MQTKGHELLISRTYDALEQSSRRNQPVVTSFLTPAEQQIVQQICKYRAVFSGGYDQAERKTAVILPEDADEWMREDFGIVCLKAETDPYSEPLRHPDVLGALMHSGISREITGDILCSDRAVFLFVRSHMAEFVCDEIRQIRRQNITFSPCEASDLPEVNREKIEINVPSLRFDAVVAGLARCSRSKAEDMIRMGFVRINDVILDQKGQLCNNDVVSVRRCGRFLFLGVKNTTRKNRLVLEFLKYS